jgi:hypothetical protein
MSAAAKMWASTHNGTLAGKMSAVVDALHACQQAPANGGAGYLSAFPTEFFDRFEAIQPVWAPYYTIHKVPPSSSKTRSLNSSALLRH